MNPELKPLFEAATRPYAGAGRHALYFARGKLRYDPVFFALLRRGLISDQGRLLDLGCGRGVLLTLLEAAKQQFSAAQWPQGWPAPPSQLALHGIELRGDRVLAARLVLGQAATVELHDIARAEFPACTTVILLDVLFYLPESTQRQVLKRVAAALQPGGVLLLREADAGAGRAFRMTRWAERVACAVRGQPRQKLYYRSAGQWKALLEELGFAVSAEPMSEGTPFANVLFVARHRVPATDNSGTWNDG